jgi:hypothetical protein
MNERHCAASGESGVVSTTALTVNFTLHISGNVIYHFMEEYQQVTRVDRYMQD